MKEERLATQEMLAMDKRIESWSQLTPAVPSARSVKSAAELASARDITKDLPPEVAAFEVTIVLLTSFHYAQRACSCVTFCARRRIIDVGTNIVDVYSRYVSHEVEFEFLMKF